MGAREVERVFGGLEQGHRAANVVQRCGGFALHLAKSRERPVEAHAHVRVVSGVASALQRFAEHATGALELAAVAQGVAECGRVAHLDGRVEMLARAQLLDAAFEHLHRSFRHACACIGTRERGVEVEPLRNCVLFVRQSFLEQSDRDFVLPTVVLEVAKRDPGAVRVLFVAREDGFFEDLDDCRLRDLCVTEP